MAPPEGMLGAALIPFILILGLLVLAVFGAWPMGLFTGAVVIALLIGIAAGLARTTKLAGAET